MNGLPKIQDYNGKKAVSAKELYDNLGLHKAHWAKWYRKNITENPFAIEKEDWIPLTLGVSSPGSQDFALSIKFAKKLSMMARTPEGERVRDYFIEVEKMAKENRPAVPTSTLDILKLAIQGLEEQQKGLDEVKKEVRELKAATKTTPDYFAIMGYASLNKIQIGLTLAASLGRKAKRICETHGYPIESIPDPRFGRVHTYPYSVLERVFNENVV